MTTMMTTIPTKTLNTSLNRASVKNGLTSDPTVSQMKAANNPVLDLADVLTQLASVHAFLSVAESFDQN